MNPVAEGSTRVGDASLRQRLLDGDPSALAVVYDVHAGVVHGIALRVTNDAASAEDITQEVFVALWKQPDRFDPAQGSLRTFLSMLAHRRSVDLVRSQVARAAREERTAHRGARSDDSGSVEEQVLARVDADGARSSLSCLPAEQRECLELAYLAGLTFREVAQHLKIPEGTAKSRIRLGLKRLQKVMAAYPSVIAGRAPGDISP